MTEPKIPFAKLGIPLDLEPRLARDAPSKIKRAIAKGAVPVLPAAQLGVLYVLASDPDDRVAKTARKALRELPSKILLNQISIKTHPKILEFLAEFRTDEPALDERIAMLRTANDRTTVLIAKRAHAGLCEMLSRNHERLLVTPQVMVSLHANPNCPDSAVERASSFLRMQDSLPELPEVRPFLQRAGEEDFVSLDADAPTAEPDASEPSADPLAPDPLAPDPLAPDPLAPDPLAPDSLPPSGQPAAGGVDLMAEIEAALRGDVSPMLVEQHQERLKMFDLGQLDESAADDSGFQFDFADTTDGFSFDLTADHSNKEGDERGEIRKSIEQKIKDMSVGQKIKLAYLGNKEARAYLIRDRNRIVAGAVVKSGRLTDQEVASFAGNKNLDGDVIREIAANREWIRKYPVKVSLVNNPKTPVAQAVAMVGQLQKKDLLQLTRNRNIPSVVGQAANRLYRQKYKQM